MALVAWLWLAGPLGADALDPIFGRWGSPAQCAGAIMVPGGSKRAEAIVISRDWLRQGAIWCRLIWFEPQQRDSGLYAGARAGCGEDAARFYWLGLSLDQTPPEPMLTVIWDESLVNGPMARCRVE